MILIELIAGCGDFKLVCGLCFGLKFNIKILMMSLIFFTLFYAKLSLKIPKINM